MHHAAVAQFNGSLRLRKTIRFQLFIDERVQFLLLLNMLVVFLLHSVNLCVEILYLLKQVSNFTNLHGTIALRDRLAA